LLFFIAIWGACPHEARAGQTTERPRRREDPFARFRKLDPQPAPLLGAEPAWRLTLAAPPSAGGVMDDSRVYVPLRDMGLAAIDRETGRLAWFRALTSAFAPVVHDGALFVASTAGLEALDAATGADRWTVPLHTPVNAPLLWDTGWLIAIVEPSDVVAFRASDGRMIWRRPLGSPSAFAPVPGGDGALFFSLMDGRVIALSLSDGTPLWERTLPGTLSEPAVSENHVFVGSTDNTFYALDAGSGELDWRWRGGGDVIGASVDGDSVYFASLDNVIRAVNRGNGNQRWKKETGTRPIFPPQAFGGVVALPGLSPAMTVFVGKTGVLQGTYGVPGNVIGPPLIDTRLKPFRVTFVAITRDGVVEAARSTGLIFSEPLAVPLAPLPGRPLVRDRLE
jgi:outer membrane protein assembly factor BamB